MSTLPVLWAIVGLALAESPDAPTARVRGEQAEASLAFGEAVAAFRQCEHEGSDRDRRYCATRLRVLASQEADNFAGWTTLARVRRDRIELSDAEATTRIQAALDANPTGPAADELRRWLVHLDVSRGKTPSIAIAPADRVWISERIAAREQIARHRNLGIGAGVVAAACLGLALRGSQPLATKGALLAALVVGVVPAFLAAEWNADLWIAFLRNAFVVWIAALVAPRLHPIVAIIGVLSGLFANAAASDWLVSLGMP